MKAKNGWLMAAALACAGALAQAPADSAATDQLAPVTENGVTYVCGGIGSNEAAQMKRAAAGYNLMLTFAENTGAYLADVDVDISDARGNALLQTTCDAPIMLVNLPKAGNYRIKAEVEGHALSRVVHVRPGAKGAAVAMAWPRRLIEGAQPRG